MQGYALVAVIIAAGKFFMGLDTRKSSPGKPRPNLIPAGLRPATAGIRPATTLGVSNQRRARTAHEDGLREEEPDEVLWRRSETGEIFEAEGLRAEEEKVLKDELTHEVIRDAATALAAAAEAVFANYG